MEEQNMPDTIYDLVIIGGGPTGISCGIEASKADLNYIILEKGVLVNSIYHFPTNMTFFSTAPKIEIGDLPFIAHNEKPQRNEALEYYRRVVFHYNLNILMGEKVIKINKDTCFTITTEKSNYYAKNIILATGYYDLPVMMKIPGEDLPKVKHYYSDPHPYIKKNVVVVGGANSACDVALELWSKGANVTMVIRESQLYQGVKYWILPNIENRINEGSIAAFFNAQLSSVSEKNVNIKTKDGMVEIDNDYVLAMTGYQIDYGFLKASGVAIGDDEFEIPVFDNETLESNVKGLYLAGVIISGKATSKLFIENTRHHGAVIVEDIKKKYNKKA